MSLIYVGTNGDYSSISSAIDAAVHGDIIAIYPGIYEEYIVINKLVHLRGITNFPQDGEILIQSNNADQVLSINYTPTSEESMYIEGIEFKKLSTSTWRRVIWVESNANLSLYINRCIVSVAASTQYPIAFVSGQTSDPTLVVEHSKLTRGYAHILQVNWDGMNHDGKIYKVILNNTYYCYSCSGSPSVLDYVTNDITVGYGPAYGEYYTTLYRGYFDGYVYENDTPVERKLYFHRREDGSYLGTTTSSGDGYYYFQTTYSGSHYIVCLDDHVGVDYNDLIHGDVYPTEITTTS